MEKEWKSLELWRSVIAECLATFFYVFLACAVTLNWTPNVYKVFLTTPDLLQISLAFGLSLCTLIQCFGHISGGHINPAISIATLVTCKVTPLRGILYVTAQCGGGIAGAALLYGIVPGDTRGQLGSTLLHPSLSPSQGLGVEFLMTFILTFTFFATVDPRRANRGNEAIPLGLTMTLLHIVGYRLTGSSCNPARSFGPAFVKNTWSNHWVYWAGPIGGAVVAGLLYQFVFAHSRGQKMKSCSLAGLQQVNNGESNTMFSIYGNRNKKKSPETGVSADTQAVNTAYTCDLTATFFRAEATRKYLAQSQEPKAPPGSIETGLDIVIPFGSTISSDVIPQASPYSVSSIHYNTRTPSEYEKNPHFVHEQMMHPKNIV